MQNKNIKKLEEIAEIILGYTFRSSLKPSLNGACLVVQARNISNELLIEDDDLLKINLENNRTKSFAKNNDIALSSRGIFKSSVIKTKSNNIIASSSVYLLRLKVKEVLPEYLAICLNSDEVQKKIQERISGAVIKNLLRRDLGAIEIKIPDIDNQKKIISIYFNNLGQSKKLNKKIELTEKISKQLINKIINS